MNTGNYTLRGRPTGWDHENARSLYCVCLVSGTTLCPHPYTCPCIVDAKGFEIISVTAWYPRGYDTKPG